MELTTDQKGTIAETAVIHAAVKLDVPVLRPLNDGLSYDLLFDLFDRLETTSRRTSNWADDFDFAATLIRLVGP